MPVPPTRPHAPAICGSRRLGRFVERVGVARLAVALVAAVFLSEAGSSSGAVGGLGRRAAVASSASLAPPGAPPAPGVAGSFTLFASAAAQQPSSTAAAAAAAGVRPPSFSGSIYFYFKASEKLERTVGLGGGPNTLHMMHWSLRQLGYSTAMHTPARSIRATDELFYTDAVPEIIEVDEWPPPNLSRNDVVVFPEVYAKVDILEPTRVALERARASGARIVFLALGLHDPEASYRLSFSRHTTLAISEGIAAEVGVLALVPLWRPLERFLYDASERWLNDGGSSVVGPATNERNFTRGKRDVVLFDNDTPYRADINRGLRRIKFQGVWLTRKTREELIEAYMSAKVIVDGELPGPERIPLEASMFGVVPILSSTPRGATDADVPCMPEHRIEISNTPLLINSIVSAALAQGRVWGDENPGMREAFRLRTTWRSGLELYFGSLAVAFDIVAPPGGEWAAVVAAAHAVLHYPLARVHLGVASLEAYRASGALELANSSQLAGAIFLRSGADGAQPLPLDLAPLSGGLPTAWAGLLVGLPPGIHVTSSCFVGALEAHKLEAGPWSADPGPSALLPLCSMGEKPVRLLRLTGSEVQRAKAGADSTQSLLWSVLGGGGKTPACVSPEARAGSTGSRSLFARTDEDWAPPSDATRTWLSDRVRAGASPVERESARQGALVC